MIHCSRCNKIMLLSSKSGYCDNCAAIVIEEEQKARQIIENENKALEKALKEAKLECKRLEEARRVVEELMHQEKEALLKRDEEFKRQEAEHRKAEEIRRQREEEERRKAEEIRRQREKEERRKAEEIKRQKEEEERRKAEEIRRQKEEEERQKTDQFEKQREEEKYLKAEKKSRRREKQNVGVTGKIKTGCTIHIGKYVQEGKKADPTPLTWIVLTIIGSKALLLSKYAIDEEPFYEDMNDGITSIHENEEDQPRTTWEKSTIRSKLNGKFFNSVFSESEKKAILLSCVKNDAGEGVPGNEYLAESTTSDRIFLLSYNEAERYLGEYPSSPLRKAKQTKYCRAWGNDYDSLGCDLWWLRSLTESGTGAIVVDCDGRYAYQDVNCGEVAIRPAMWIDINVFEKLLGDDDSDFINTESDYSKTKQTLKNVEKKYVLINSFSVKLTGVTQNNEGANKESRQQIIQELYQRGLLDPGQELELRPDQKNRYDDQSVAVYGPDKRQIGLLPRKVAHEIFNKLQSSEKYKAVVTDVTGGGIETVYGVKVRIEEYQNMEKSVTKSYSSDNAKIDYKKAMIYFNKGNFEKALPPLQRAAEFGHPDAQYRLGTCYDYGYGVKVDAEKASSWYLKAAEQGQADAQADLGYNYREGIGVAVDYKKALYWLQKAIENNQANAMVFLGSMYEKGIGVQKNEKKSFELYKRAANLGNVDGANNTGIALLVGRGVERNPEEALIWNLKAAIAEQKTAQFNVARQYLNGDGVQQDIEQAISWLKRAAMNGHPQAIAALQQM